MKNLVIKEQINAVQVNEVEAQVKDQMKHFGYPVFASEQEVRGFFLTEFGKETYTEIAQEFTVKGEQNGDWETTITVVIKAHYCDSGSEDYAYTIEVTED